MHSTPDARAPEDPSAAPTLTIGPGEVHLWRWVATAEVTRIGAPLLSAAERRRAARFSTLVLEQNYVAAKGLSRHMLGLYLGRPGGEIAIEDDAKGKPRVAVAHLSSAPLHFNITHSGDLLLLAVARDMEVGVDVEQVRSLGDPERDALDLARQCCTSAEVMQLAALPASARPRAFACIWTRKEAVGKACGEGLGLNFRSFAVPYPEQNGTATVPAGPGRPAHGWTVTALDVGHGCEGALASERPPAKLLFGAGVPKTAAAAQATLSAEPWAAP